MSVTLGYVINYVPEVGAAVDFYRNAFGLKQRFVTPEGDYGELETGSTTLAFVATELAKANLAGAGGFTPLNASTTPVGATIVLVADDVPALFETAVAAGARRYVEPVEKPWGQTVAYVIDPFGAMVELASPVATG